MPRRTEEYNLAAMNPDPVKQWHPKKNGKFTPLDVTPVSGMKVEEKSHV